jgi:hypothetical protein
MNHCKHIPYPSYHVWTALAEKYNGGMHIQVDRTQGHVKSILKLGEFRVHADQGEA